MFKHCISFLFIIFIVGFIFWLVPQKVEAIGFGSALPDCPDTCGGSPPSDYCSISAPGDCNACSPGSDSSCCSGGSSWTKYAASCKLDQDICDWYWVYDTAVCSIGDKCVGTETGLRSGSCTCASYSSSVYKYCCAADGAAESCTQGYPDDGTYPSEGACPGGNGWEVDGSRIRDSACPGATVLTDVYYCSGNSIRYKKSDGTGDRAYCDCNSTGALADGSGTTNDCKGTNCITNPNDSNDAYCITKYKCVGTTCTAASDGTATSCPDCSLPNCNGGATYGSCTPNSNNACGTNQGTESCTYTTHSDGSCNQVACTSRTCSPTCSSGSCVNNVCITSSSCGGDGQAACCDPNQVNMGISPNPVNAGNQISFSINGSQGSTRFNDTWSGGTDCSGGFWNSTKTCNATSAVTNATWTHTWRNCMPNDGSCDQNGYQTCSKSVPYTINPGTPNPPSSVTASCPIPGTQATINITASAGATKYALRMKDTAIGWGTPTSCSDSDNLLTGSICNDNITTTTYSFTSTKNQTSLAGHTYGGWVHACNSSGCSGATYTNPSAFTCIVVPPTPTVDTTKLSCITSADTSSTNGSKIDISWTNTNNIIPITWIDIIDNAGSYFHKDVRGLTPGPDGKIHTDGTEFSWFAGTPTPNPTLTFNANTTYTIRSWNNYVNSATAPFPISPIPLCSCEGGIGACGSAINSDPDPNSIATCDGTWTHDFMGDEWCAVNVNATRNRCYRCGASIGPWIQTTGDVHSNTGINAPGGP